MLTSDGCSAAVRPLRHVPLLHFRCGGALCLGTCATALGPALHGSPLMAEGHRSLWHGSAERVFNPRDVQ